MIQEIDNVTRVYQAVTVYSAEVRYSNLYAYKGRWAVKCLLAYANLFN